MENTRDIIAELCARFNALTPEEKKRNDDEIRRYEAEQAEKKKLDRYSKSGAPERYQKESIATYKITTELQRTAAAAAAGFITRVKCCEFRTLIMLGDAGTGKTHLACAIIRECGGKYRTAPEIVEELRRAKSFTANFTEAEILAFYARVPVLVIDEIGRGIAATDEKYMLYQVLNARYNTRLPTVLVSNHTKKDFLQYVGIAAADRLVESADIYELIGDSYRRELRGAV